MSASIPTHGRRAVALLMTMLLVVLLVAAVSRLATATAVDALRTDRRVNTLQHELAVDSLLAVLPGRFANERLAKATFTRTGAWKTELQVGECTAHCLLTSDAGKFNVGAFDASTADPRLRRKLSRLQSDLALPRVGLALRPIDARNRSATGALKRGLPRYLWFDQLLQTDDVDAVFLPLSDHATDAGRRAPRTWSDAVTFFGDGRVDLLHAHPVAIRVLLDDVDRTLASRLATLRAQAEISANFAAALAGRDAATAEQVHRLVGIDIPRYAATVRTGIGGDQRHWYLVFTMDEESVTAMHYRGQIRW